MTAHPQSVASAPGLVTPESDEAAWQGGSEGAVEKRSSPDCAAPAAERKAFSTLRARLAHAGWVLTEEGDGTYFASRWGRSRELGDLPAVEAFARMVGAAR